MVTPAAMTATVAALVAAGRAAESPALAAVTRPRRRSVSSKSSDAASILERNRPLSPVGDELVDRLRQRHHRCRDASSGGHEGRSGAGGAPRHPRREQETGEHDTEQEDDAGVGLDQEGDDHSSGTDGHRRGQGPEDAQVQILQPVDVVDDPRQQFTAGHRGEAGRRQAAEPPDDVGADLGEQPEDGVVGSESFAVAERSLADPERPHRHRGDGQLLEQRALRGADHQPGRHSGEADRAHLGHDPEQLGADEPQPDASGQAERPTQGRHGRLVLVQRAGSSFVHVARHAFRYQGRRLGASRRHRRHRQGREGSGIHLVHGSPEVGAIGVRDPILPRARFPPGIRRRHLRGGLGTRVGGPPVLGSSLPQFHDDVGDQVESGVVGDDEHPRTLVSRIDELGRHIGGGVVVEMRRRFIRHDEPGLAPTNREQGTRHGQPLVLSSRQRGRIPVHRPDQAERSQGLLAGLIGGTHRPEPHRRSHRVVQRRRLLGNPGDGPAPILQGHLVDSDRADPDLAGIGRDHPAQHVDQGRLAGTVRSSDDHDLAGLDQQVGRSEAPSPVRVIDHHPPSRQRPGGRDALVALAHRRQGEERLHLVGHIETCGGGVEGGTHPAQGQHALGSQQQHDQCPFEPDRSVDQPHTQGHGHQGDGQGGDQLEHGRRQERHAERLEHGPSVAVGDLRDVGDLRLGPPEEPQRGESRQHVEEVSRQALQRGPLPAGPLFGHAADQHHEDRDQRHRDDHDQRRPRIGDEDDQAGDGRDDRGGGEGWHVPPRPRLEGVQAGGEQRGHPGRSGLGTRRSRQPGHVVEHLAADQSPGAAHRQRRRPGRQGAREPAERRHDEQRQDQRSDGPVSAVDQRRQVPADSERQCEHRDHHDDRGHARDDQMAPQRGPSQQSRVERAACPLDGFVLLAGEVRHSSGRSPQGSARH